MNSGSTCSSGATLSKVPETLAVAHEFIEMPFTDGQDVAVSQLLKELKHEYDSKDQKLMKRKPSIIKAAHMLIVAQSVASLSTLPAILAADAKKIVATVPRLMKEIFNIASMPINRAGHSYARPQISFMEFYQCFHAGRSALCQKARSRRHRESLAASTLQRENVNPVAKKCKSVSALLKLSSEDVIKLFADLRDFPRRPRTWSATWVSSRE